MDRHLLILIALLMLQFAAIQTLPQESVSKQITLDTCADGTYRNGVNCEPCSTCNDYELLTQKCNNTHDSVCQCKSGFYRDVVDRQCKECLKCAAGWGASPACSSTANTVCVVCPRGSYSSVKSSTKSCQSCTLCDRSDELALQKCTSERDTTCLKVKKKVSTLKQPATTTGCIGNECIAPKDNSYLYTAPLYCAVLGAIVLGLLIYVVFRCKSGKKRAQTAYPNIKQNSSYQIVQQGYNHIAAPSTPIVCLQDGGKTVTITVSTRFSDLPSHIRRAIARSLSVDGSWLSLAHILGFSPSQISEVQKKAEENNKISSVGSVLMSEWAKRDFSTVGVIIHALASINRLDLVALIQNSNSMKGSEIV